MVLYYIYLTLESSSFPFSCSVLLSSRKKSVQKKVLFVISGQLPAWLHSRVNLLLCRYDGYKKRKSATDRIRWSVNELKKCNRKVLYAILTCWRLIRIRTFVLNILRRYLLRLVSRCFSFSRLFYYFTMKLVSLLCILDFF